MRHKKALPLSLDGEDEAPGWPWPQPQGRALLGTLKTDRRGPDLSEHCPSE